MSLYKAAFIWDSGAIGAGNEIYADTDDAAIKKAKAAAKKHGAKLFGLHEQFTLRDKVTRRPVTYEGNPMKKRSRPKRRNPIKKVAKFSPRRRKLRKKNPMKRGWVIVAYSWYANKVAYWDGYGFTLLKTDAVTFSDQKKARDVAQRAATIDQKMMVAEYNTPEHELLRAAKGKA